MALSKYKVSWVRADLEPEVINASNYFEEGEWFIFEDGNGDIARLRAKDVARIDRVAA